MPSTKRNKPKETMTICGGHIVKQVVLKRPDMVQVAYFDSRKKHTARMMALAEETYNQGISIEWVSGEKLDKMSSYRRHQGIALACEARAWWSEADMDPLLEQSSCPFIMVLDGVQDPHNLGAILRSSHMMGVDIVIAPKHGACGLNETVHQVSCGASVLTPYIQLTNLARVLQDMAKKGVWITALDAKADVPLSDIDFKGPVALVMGSEGSGARRLSLKHCDFYAHIPMVGCLDSLNVSVAAGMAMYEVQRQRAL